MRTITNLAEMTAVRDTLSGSVGLVPTMGYLHEGHLSLVRQARADNDHVIVTIFVNPTQFGPNEDLARYPRDEKRDLALLDAILSPLSRPSAEGGAGPGVRAHHGSGSYPDDAPHIIFIPTTDEIYPPGFDDWVEVTGPIAERLEGAHRPGHFRGVTTVCARFFRIIRPTRAYFGQKDAQQLRIIRRMVAEQRLGVDIIPMPIVREPDGLAMSSRNVYLTPAQRPIALRLSQSLRLAERMVVDEGVTNAETIRSAIRNSLLSPLPRSGRGMFAAGERGEGKEPPLEIDYIAIADDQTLEELETVDLPTLILLAARVGSTRLIDNAIALPKDIPVHLSPSP